MQPTDKPMTEAWKTIYIYKVRPKRHSDAFGLMSSVFLKNGLLNVGIAVLALHGHLFHCTAHRGRVHMSAIRARGLSSILFFCPPR